MGASWIINPAGPSSLRVRYKMAQLVQRRNPEEALRDALQARGYSQRDAVRITESLEQLRGDRGVFTHRVLDTCMRLAASRYGPDVWRMMERWNRVSPRAVSVSELTPAQAADIASAARGPSADTSQKLASSIAFLPLPGGTLLSLREIETMWRLFNSLAGSDKRKLTPRPPLAVPMRRRQEPSEEAWQS